MLFMLLILKIPSSISQELRMMAALFNKICHADSTLLAVEMTLPPLLLHQVKHIADF